MGWDEYHLSGLWGSPRFFLSPGLHICKVWPVTLALAPGLVDKAQMGAGGLFFSLHFGDF